MYHISINSQLLPFLKKGMELKPYKSGAKCPQVIAHTSNLAATGVTSQCPAMNTLTQWNVTHMSEQIPDLKFKLCSVQQQFKHL